MPSPADLVGGLSADPTWHLGWLRYVLVALAVLAVLLPAWRRRLFGVAAALAFAAVGTGFWIAALGRPYGLFLDEDATRRAALIAIAAARNDPAASPLAGEVAVPTASTRLAARGAAGAVLQARSWAPALAVVAIGLLVAAIGPPGRRGLGTVLWCALASGGLEDARGGALVPRAWAAPEAALLAVPAAALALMALRWPERAVLRTLVAALVPALACLPGDGGTPAPIDTWLAMTMDQWPWIALAVLGWRRAPCPPLLALAVSAAGLEIAAALGAPVAGLTAHALLRLAVLLAAVPGLQVAGGVLSELAGPRVAHVLAGGDRAAAGTALILLAVLPGSFLTAWNPRRADPVFAASGEPLSVHVVEPLRWLASVSAPGDAVLASHEMAGPVVVLAGRPVLRAPGLAVAADDERRRRVERAVLAGRAIPQLVERYNLRFVVAAPGDFWEHGIASPGQLRGRGGLRLVHLTAEGVHVYAVPR